MAVLFLTNIFVQITFIGIVVSEQRLQYLDTFHGRNAHDMRCVAPLTGRSLVTRVGGQDASLPEGAYQMQLLLMTFKSIYNATDKETMSCVERPLEIGSSDPPPKFSAF